MADRPFMQFYGSDLVGDTLHLSAEQIGAYMLLLIAMWNAGGILPNDPTKLARISRLTAAKWAKISPDILDLFDLDDVAIWHKRVQKEIEKMNEKRAKNARSGSLGGTARALKHNASPQANATKTLKRNPSIARATPEPEPELEGFPRGNPKSTPTASPSRAEQESWWLEFWGMFPNKVGKPDAGTVEPDAPADVAETTPTVDQPALAPAEDAQPEASTGLTNPPDQAPALTDDQIFDIRGAGIDARKNGFAKSKNPHAAGTEANQVWAKGYDDEKKREAKDQPKDF